MPKPPLLLSVVNQYMCYVVLEKQTVRVTTAAATIQAFLLKAYDESIGNRYVIVPAAAAQYQKKVLLTIYLGSVTKRF